MFYPMKLFRAMFAAMAAVLAAAASAADAPRFSRTLTDDERAQTGLSRLSSDQVASMDALVRRTIGGRISTPSPAADSDAAPAQPPKFSQQLTADERRVTGVELLTGEEVVRLDQLVERHATSSVARALLAPPTYVRRGSVVRPSDAPDKRNIHGSYSLSYGFGKGGYSEKTGAMIVNFEDPAGRYMISIGYAETHVKGAGPYRIYRDLPHRDLPYRDLPPPERP
jgi:hypothetical protein